MRVSVDRPGGSHIGDGRKKKHIELVLGSFLAPEANMIFGDGVGASLVRSPYCQPGVGLCDVDAFRTAEEGAWVGLKQDSKEAPDSTC